MNRGLGALPLAVAIAIGATTAVVAAPGPAQKAVIDHFAALVKAKDASFGGFSADAGRAFFMAKQTGGEPDTDSCTSCHTANPKVHGETRAGQDIDPMAVSVNPQRFTDLKTVEKWFGRNCDTVLGRECTSIEKGNFLTFMTSQ